MIVIYTFLIMHAFFLIHPIELPSSTESRLSIILNALLGSQLRLMKQLGCFISDIGYGF